ncbi:DHH family phosphoesterase [Spirochaetia bacterium]|nr:DHH family phosphoesterase [Spirochaetia bacterium]
MKKREIATVAEKNRIAANIIHDMTVLDSFILVGHRDPDMDCIASLVAMALLLRKLDKEAAIFLPGRAPEYFNYLFAICKYNQIRIHYGDDDIPGDIKGVIILDTPKPVMIALNGAISTLLADPKIRKIEIDHHVQTDAVYAGDSGCCLVSEASSTCELIGYLSLKTAKHLNWEKEDIFSRNISLAILTGLVGDSNMGKYLKSHRERWYYDYFSAKFDKLLGEKNHRNGKGLSSEVIFNTIQYFSVQDKNCFDRIMGSAVESPSVFYSSLSKDDSAALFEQYGNDRVVTVSKAAADTLAEDSGKLGLVAYYDDPASTDFIQFRLRRSGTYTELDLRGVLKKLKINNGGGHPGAIGFRIPKGKVAGLPGFIRDLVGQLEELVKGAAKQERGPLF